MKQQSKLTGEHQHQHAVQAGTEQQAGQNAREFSSAEEMLRFDAAQTSVPSGIAQRLQQSVGTLPRPRRSWWQRLFGGGEE